MREAARVLQAPIRTLEDWKSAGKIKPRKDGRWDTKAIWECYATSKKLSEWDALMRPPQSRTLSANDVVQLKLETMVAVRDLKQEQAREKRMRNDLEEGRLLAAASVAEGVGRLLSVIVEHLDQLPEWLSTALHLAPADLVAFRARLARLMDQVRTEAGKITLTTAAEMYAGQPLEVGEDEEEVDG